MGAVLDILSLTNTFFIPLAQLSNLPVNSQDKSQELYKVNMALQGKF
jgi:hypothetical protein